MRSSAWEVIERRRQPFHQPLLNWPLVGVMLGVVAWWAFIIWAIAHHWSH